MTTTQVDFLVVGSGIAGLTFALKTANVGKTLILTKKNRADSNSNWAQGGIACVAANDDNPRLHAEDTRIAGAGLCHTDAVDILVTEGPDRVDELIQLGAQFDTAPDSSGHEALALGREGGHSRNRIVHFADKTGWECERALLAAAEAASDLEIFEHYFVLDLAILETETGRRCVGAYALDTEKGEIHLFQARTTLLATGGAGQVYLHTTNPEIATGDGVAMAWRAGSSVENMEFIQFHPTSLCHPKGKSFLITEAMRGEGGLLRTSDGATFMHRYHDLKDLAPRDIVARAIHAERLKRGDECVYLDITHRDSEFIRSHFPTIYERLLVYGIDITRQQIPVVPAAHYSCGGVPTDLDGQTEIDGLYAAGEVASTGVHGANRLASNSLLEAMVFGHRAAVCALKDWSGRESTAPSNEPEHGTQPSPRDIIGALALRLKSVMNDRVGIVRNDESLERANAEVREILDQAETLVACCLPDPDLWELRNMAQVADLIIRCALLRNESRGLHYNVDYPDRDDLLFGSDTVLHPEHREDGRSS